mmetsp:Transcript_30195/g.65218  ORF Transcript_30195/g.65218 Transcript_30195/m.65218 type:complete len:610 (-) Transcript_30195:47-1876(-)
MPGAVRPEGQPLSSNSGGSFPSGDEGDPEVQQPQKKGCFPINLFGWLPPQIKWCIPGTWQVIQDATHLSLVIGMVSLVTMVVLEVAEVATGHFMHDLAMKVACVVIICCFVFVYMMQIISRYDQSIVEREATIKRQRQDLVNNYEDLVQDIDGMLNRATESTQELAEGEFNSKRMDFFRFLNRMETRFTNELLPESEKTEIVNNFKTFLLKWLKLYEECSLDPINKPFVLITPAQLDQYSTIPEICNEVKKLLNAHQVYFSREIDQGKEEIKSKQEFAKRMSQPVLPLSWNPSTNSNNKSASSARAPPSEIELSSNIQFSHNHHDDDEGSDEDVEAPPPQRTMSGREMRVPRAAQNKGGRKSPCQWMVLGSSGCGPCPPCCSYTGTQFPKKVGCLCFAIVFLSPEHLRLMFGFVATLVLSVYELLALGFIGIKGRGEDDLFTILILVPCIGCLQALIFMLMFFEHIDIIQRMEQELATLEAESTALKDKKEKMVEYWEQVQAITDIWVHRVTPRMLLYKEAHVALEDLRKPQDFNKGLATVNSSLQALEARLPALGHWRADGDISAADKKRFSDSLKKITARASEEGLPYLCENVMRLSNTQDSPIPRG